MKAKTKKKQPGEYFGFRVSPQVAAQLRAKAKAEYRSVSAVIVMLLEKEFPTP